MSKILFICASSQSIYNFRVPLIKKLKIAGYQVETISFDNNYSDLLIAEGIKNHCVLSNNRTVNPFEIARLKKSLYKKIVELKPDIVFTFVAKPNIYGVLAAKKAKIKNIFSMVEGAGDPFINLDLKWRIIKFIECKLFKKAFKNAKTVFFLNNDDKEEFVDLKLVKENQAFVIDGIGIDLDKFAYKPVQKQSNSFIMVARMLKTKGVLDYCKCAQLVRQKFPNAVFHYLGSEGSIKIADIKDYIESGDIVYHGSVSDVIPYLEDSLMLLLPSYREGKPMSIMEAESVGRGIIASDVIGCRDTVIDGYNGFLFKKNDYEKMADLCLKVLNNKDLAVEFGIHSREYAEKHYNQDTINSIIINVIQEKMN